MKFRHISKHGWLADLERDERKNRPHPAAPATGGSNPAPCLISQPQIPHRYTFCRPSKHKAVSGCVPQYRSKQGLGVLALTD